MEPPSATIGIDATDDVSAMAQARTVSPAFFADDADFAWLIDEAGQVVGSFPLAFGRAA